MRENIKDMEVFLSVYSRKISEKEIILNLIVCINLEKKI
jgi:hypothetical protein